MLDELDLKLLDELENNGLQKPHELASKLDVPARTVYWRLNKMRQDKVFKMIAVPNPVSLGYNAWAEIGIRIEPGYLDHVVGQLKKHRDVYLIATTLGKFDVIVNVLFETINQLTIFVNNELEMINGIRSTETILLVHPRKYLGQSWPSLTLHQEGTDHQPNHLSNRGYILDETDKDILNILQSDGFTKIPLVSQQLGLTQNTIRRRINNIFNCGHYYMQILPNPAILHYEAWATIGIKVKNQSADKVIEKIIKNPFVSCAWHCIGRFNILIHVRFHEIDHLRKFTQYELMEIAGIYSIATFPFPKPLKSYGILWEY